MRTNIDLDVDLVNKAFQYSSAKTKKELIHVALKEYVKQKRRLNLLDLEGKIVFEESYNHKQMRDGQ